MIDIMLDGMAILGLAVVIVLLIGVLFFSVSSLVVFAKAIFKKWFRK